MQGRSPCGRPVSCLMNGLSELGFLGLNDLQDFAISEPVLQILRDFSCVEMTGMAKFHARKCPQTETQFVMVKKPFGQQTLVVQYCYKLLK